MSIINMNMKWSHLFEDLRGHLVAAVKDDAKLPSPLHLLQEGSGVLGVQGQLADLQPDVVPGGGHDELLEANQTCRESRTMQRLDSLEALVATQLG